MSKNDAWLNHCTMMDADMLVKITPEERRDLEEHNEEFYVAFNYECEDALMGFPTAPELYEHE